jgi:S-formylglutathione hydrolase
MEKSGANLKRYAAVKFDVGTMDNLLAPNRQMDAAMTNAGIPHMFETYEGDHNGRIAERLETKVFPFFSANLAFK